MTRGATIIVVCIVAAAVSSYLVMPLKTTLYQSTARILFDAGSNPIDFFDADATEQDQIEQATRGMRRSMDRMTSPAVRSVVESQLGFSPGIDPFVEAGFDVLQLRAFDQDPQRAQQVAEAYASAYFQVAEAERVVDQTATEAELLERIDQLDDEIAALAQEDAARLEMIRADLLDSYDRLVLTRELGGGETDILIDAPTLPAKPFSVEGRTVANLLLGGLAGLAIGTGIAVFDRRHPAAMVA